MTPEDEALRVLARGLIEIRATAWGAIHGGDPEAQLEHIGMIADALHNLPGAVGVAIADEVLTRESRDNPAGRWLTTARASIARTLEDQAGPDA